MTLRETTSITPPSTSTRGDDSDEAVMDGIRYERSDCRPLAIEDRIVRDVYGCDAGRSCADVTLEQRFCFEKQIAERLAALPTQMVEAT